MILLPSLHRGWRAGAAVAALFATAAQAAVVDSAYIRATTNEISGLLGQYSRPSVYLDRYACGEQTLAAYACYPNVISLGSRFLQGQENSYGNYVGKFIFAHEWGHTVQFAYSIRLRSPYQELQADCFGGTFVKYAQASLGYPSFIESAVRSARNAADYSTHGTPSQRDYYTRRGYATSVNTCLNNL
ncbi:hypothetical protein [Eleftheria terrae]|uniref:hypothetical protein n=1 Tax=Eleftheria terrae TaxID=1597781 RepID=UPI00263AE612|nr:hypothetical protein [Eleftheria terrae]WKB51786.1 neutral zinc metallopeptidase [Eleftheria terrae]